MAMTLLGTGGFYTRIGRIGKALRSLAQYRAGGLGDDIEGMAAQYDTLRNVLAPVIDAQPDARARAGAIASALSDAATATLVQMVTLDQPARAWTAAEAAEELVRQTTAQGLHVPACATSAAATALTPTAGDGVVVLTARGRDGVPLENVFAETLWLTCVADAQTGDTALYRESFRLRGGVAQADPWAADWPAGSGGDLTFPICDPAAYASDGNQLVNGGLDTFTVPNDPDGWVIEAGVAGTQILKDAANQYVGAACLALPGNATAAALSQAFGSRAGTAALLAPTARYVAHVRVKVSAVPATGTLILELTDFANTVIQNPQAANLRLTIDLTAATTGWVAHTAVWVTPRALPLNPKFRLRVGTAIEAGKTCYVDSVALQPVREAYPGGPAAAVISGAVPFAVGDGWTVAAANDRAGADFGSTWQALADRLYGFRALGLQLPSTAVAPEIADTLITS